MPQPKWPTCLSIASAILLPMAAPILIAQVTTARLEGFVRDPSEAVVPGVVMAATHKASGLAFEARTNESGFYVLAKLPPGRYEVAAEVRGFKRHQAPELILEIGDTRTLDIRLETGETSETVIVEAPLAAVDSVSVSIGSVVNTRQIEQLPLVDRNPLNLFYLQPGANRFGTGGGGVSDGLRVQASNITVEGVNAVEPQWSGGATTSYVPMPIEAVAEYRVVTSNAEPEYGRGAGSQVHVLYRSGGNRFHGSLFDFHRNKVLNANSFFNNRQGLPRPTFLRNQFGGSLGGPIIRNRIFFHFTYEGIRQKTDSSGAWSISSSYRVAYDRTWMYTATSIDAQEGTFTSRTLNAPSGMRLNALSTLFNPAAGYFNPGPVFATKAFDRLGTVIAYDPHYYIPYTGSWSLRIQRRLIGDTVLTVAYAGNKASGLPRALNLNQIEARENGFLAGFLAAQRNLSANGDPLRGEATGVFGQIWNVMSANDRKNQEANLRNGVPPSAGTFQTWLPVPRSDEM